MGSFLVIMEQKLLGHLLHLLQSPGPMDLQAFLTKRTVKSLHIRIEVWATRRDDIGDHPHTPEEPDQG